MCQHDLGRATTKLKNNDQSHAKNVFNDEIFLRYDKKTVATKNSSNDGSDYSSTSTNSLRTDDADSIGFNSEYNNEDELSTISYSNL